MKDEAQTLLINCPRCGRDIAAQIITEGSSKTTLPDGTTVSTSFARCTSRECNREFLVDEYFSLDALLIAGSHAALSASNSNKNNGSGSWQMCYPMEHIPNCPNHLPQAVEVAFMEGALALMHKLPNAAGVMFGRALDLATLSEALIIEVPKEQLDKYRESSLFKRIKILRDNKVISDKIYQLAEVIRLERNIAAHKSIDYSMDKADELRTFVSAFFELVFTTRYKVEAVRRKHQNRD